MSLLSKYGVRAQVGEDIVTSGLQLYLDAGNLNSYSGAGNTWYDISGNGRHASIVSMTFNSGNGGFLNSASSGYVDTNYTMPTSNFTVQSWYRRTSSLNTWTVVWASEIWNAGTGFVAVVDRDLISTFFRAGGSSFIEFNNNNAANWQLYTYTLASNGAAKIYINGNEVVSGTLGIPGSIPRTIKLNTRHNNTGAGLTDSGPGQVAQFMFYNRVLSDSEIQQNFNATKARFGL